MNLCNKEYLKNIFKGKRIALVGTAPSVENNEPGFVDSHDVVVRVNNYKLTPTTGKRTDVFYSYFGNAIKKKVDDLERDGVYLCMCKCPNAKFINSEWHELNNKPFGVDFRYIYRKRERWWFCKTHVPTKTAFMRSFNLLGKHVPTSGFSALIEILELEPESVYLTGFDFFTSGLHNVNEKWIKANNGDPIGHVPEEEMKWIKENLNNYPILLDAHLTEMLSK